MGCALACAAGLLVGVLSGAGGTGGRSDVVQLDGADGAALAALRGDPAGARALLRAIRPAAGDPGALVVLASIALEQGQIAEATRLARKLGALRPDAVEPKLLAALAAERKENPRADWLGAGLSALGRVHPLKPSPPLLDYDTRMLSAWMEGKGKAPPARVLDKMGVADAFLVRWAMPAGPRTKPEPELLETGARLAASDESVLVHIVALDVLASADDGPEAAARAALLDKLRATHPGAVRMLGLEQHSESEPLNERDVAAIEAAIVGEDPLPLAVIHDYLLPLLEKVDPAMASGSAMGGAVRLVVGRYSVPGLTWRMRQEPRLAEPLRERLASAFVRQADLLQRQGALLTDMFGAVALSQAAKLRGDPELSSRAERIKERCDSLRDVSRCLEPLGRLPIPSLRRRLAKERPRELEFLEEAHRLGFRCPEPRVDNGVEAEPSGDAEGDGCRESEVQKPPQ